MRALPIVSRLGFLAALPWLRFAMLAAFLSPIAMLVLLAVSAQTPIWEEYGLPTLWLLARNSLCLVLASTVFAAILGTGLASIVGYLDFPGRALISGLLILPLAFPAYLTAFVYTDFLEYAGPVQSLLRDTFGWQRKSDYWFPEIRSLPFAIMILGLVLFPYVYLVALVAIRRTGQGLGDAAQLLEPSAIKRWFKLFLPSIAPAIAGGSLVVAMEALSDFGTVDFFAVQVLTTGLFDVWINRGNLSGAAQLSFLLLIFVVVLTVAHWHLKHSESLRSEANVSSDLKPSRIGGGRLVLVYVAVLTPLILGFILPVSRLLYLAVQSASWGMNSQVLEAATSTLSLGVASAVILSALAFFLISSARLNFNLQLKFLDSLATLGYALPGIVLALGVLMLSTRLDFWLSEVLEFWFDLRPRLWISSTFSILILAYCFRYFAPAYNSVSAASQRLSPNLDRAAATLGKQKLHIIFFVHAPLLAQSCLVAALLVFVDVVKELPITLMLRPFNVETLATNVYQFASDGLLEETASGALLIVVIGCLPVWLLARSMRIGCSR